MVFILDRICWRVKNKGEIMNSSLLKKHIKKYSERIHKDFENYQQDKQEREERIKFYQSWTKDSDWDK